MRNGVWFFEVSRGTQRFERTGCRADRHWVPVDFQGFRGQPGCAFSEDCEAVRRGRLRGGGARRVCSGLNLPNTHLSTLCKVVFPNPHDTPAEPAQFTGHFAVTFPVTADLLVPKFPIGFRAAKTAGASVPKAAV